MKSWLSSLVTLTVVSTIAACSYYYSVSVEVEPAAVELDDMNTVRDYRVTVCYEGEGVPTVDLSVEAWIADGSVSEVLVIEDGSEQTVSSERDDPTSLWLDGVEVDEACDEGWVIGFALAEGSSAPAQIDWKLRGNAGSESEEEVEDGRVTMKIEAI
jgi:hypothetical protein